MTHRSIVHEVTALPCSRQAEGFLSLRLHSRYALFGFAQANDICLATDSSTADVGGGELSCSDIACPHSYPECEHQSDWDACECRQRVSGTTKYHEQSMSRTAD